MTKKPSRRVLARAILIAGFIASIIAIVQITLAEHSDSNAKLDAIGAFVGKTTDELLGTLRFVVMWLLVAFDVGVCWSFVVLRRRGGNFFPTALDWLVLLTAAFYLLFALPAALNGGSLSFIGLPS